MVRKKPMTYEECHKVINDIDHKLCNTCREWKLCNKEFYYKNKSNSIDGFNTYCIDCTKEKRKKYIEDNKEKVLQQNYEYFLKHKDKMYEQRNAWMEEYKNEMKEYQKSYRQKNKEKIKQYNDRRKKKNFKLRKGEWDKCKLFFNYSCAYCGISEKESKGIHGQKLNKEHVFNDGENTIKNCVPACRSCNSKKWEFDFNEWYSPDNEVYSKERFNRILEWIKLNS